MMQYPDIWDGYHHMLLCCITDYNSSSACFLFFWGCHIVCALQFVFLADASTNMGYCLRFLGWTTKKKHRRPSFSHYLMAWNWRCPPFSYRHTCHIGHLHIYNYIYIINVIAIVAYIGLYIPKHITIERLVDTLMCLTYIPIKSYYVTIIYIYT